MEFSFGIWNKMNDSSINICDFIKTHVSINEWNSNITVI